MKEVNGKDAELANPRKTPSQICLSEKRLKEVPSEHIILNPRMKLVTLIDLSKNMINEIPNTFLLYFNNLQVLNIQSNKLMTLNPEIIKLKSIREVRLDNNLLSSLPKAIGELTSLEILTVSNNILRVIPISISKLANSLKKLDVSHNVLYFLPQEIGNLINLQELHLNHNEFTSLPCSLSNLIKLKELGLDWLRYTPLKVCNAKEAALKSVTNSFNTLSTKLLSKSKFECNCLEFIQYLSHGTFSLNEQDINSGSSALHIACLENHYPIIKMLIQNEADVNVLDKNGYSALGIAIKNINVKAVELLLEAKVALKEGGGPLSTPMHLAISEGNPLLVKLLLSAGINPNIAEPKNLNTPMYQLFTQFDKLEHRAIVIAEALVLNGGDPNLRNLEGWAPIHVAIKKGQINAVKWAITWNNKVKDKTKMFNLSLNGGNARWTPLHLAGHSGEYDAVQLLINAGANLFIRNAEMRTPRQVSKGNLAIYKVIKCAEMKTINNKLNTNKEETFKSQDKVLFTAPNEKPLIIDSEISKIHGLLNNSPRRFSLIDNKWNPAKSYFSDRTTRKRNPNLLYLRDKVLNNAVHLYERYDALTQLMEGEKIQRQKLLEDTLTRVLSISNKGLQMDIINLANISRTPRVMNILEQLLRDVSDKIIKVKVVQMLETLIASRGIERSENRILSSSIKFPKNLLLDIQKGFKKRCSNQETN